MIKGLDNELIKTKDEVERLRAERDALREKVEKLRRAYTLARNSAAGLTNYCEESASTRRCEKELETAESIFADLEGGE